MLNIGETKVWLITDMHFNHHNIKKFCGRPDDYQDQIIHNWMEKVKPEDIVVDLGDVIFKDSYQLSSIMNSLPGYKILILGNHDHHSRTWYMERGYDFVCDGIQINPIAFSHKPLTYLPENCEWNIHGHLHNNPYDNPYDPFVKEDWHILYALEYEGYGPILLDDFLKAKGIE